MFKMAVKFKRLYSNKKMKGVKEGGKENTMKKLILLAVLCFVALAWTQSGVTGSLKWSVQGGTLTISGNGPMPDYFKAEEPGEEDALPPWNCKSITAIVIKDGVTSIGSTAFYGCNKLKSVTIPNSVNNIAENIFYGKKELISINVGSKNNDYTSVDGVLFDKEKTTLILYPVGKTNTNYTIPNSVTYIAKKAFRASMLTSVTIPNSVTNIETNAFIDTKNLMSINVSPQNDYYASDDGVLFDKAKTTLILYPAGKTNTNYTIPSTVTNIGYFSNYSKLTSVTIPNSVNTIGLQSFNCKNLMSINVSPQNDYYASDDGVLFDKAKITLIQYPVGKTNTNYMIPNTVISIGEKAFSGCGKLTSVTIPNSVTSIKYGAFHNCSGLTKIINLAIEPPGQYPYDTWPPDDVFYGVNKSNVTLEVPINSIKDYKDSYGWSEFKIKAIK